MQYRLLALMVAIAITPATAAEEPRTNLGTLTCTLTKSPEAEARNITCGFKPAGSGLYTTTLVIVMQAQFKRAIP